MTRTRRRTAVLIHYAAVAALIGLTLSDAIGLHVFVAVVAIPAMALYGLDHLLLGGLALRSADRLDEREHALVAEAHRQAHRLGLALLAVLAAAALVFGGFGLGGGEPLALVAGALLVVFVTLPAGIVLWTAPDPVGAEPTPG